jgi:hypothetical protein
VSGFGDEIAGAALAAKDYVSGEGFDYRKRQKEIENYIEQARSQNPGSYLGGNVVGAGAQALALPIGAGASLARGLGTAALQSGVSALGESKGNLDSYENVSKLAGDVGTGALTGAATQGVFGLAGKAAKAFSPKRMEDYAGRKALSAMGMTAGQIKNTQAQFGKEGAAKIGLDAIDQGIVKAFKSVDDIAETATNLKAKSGASIGSAIDSVDNLVAKVKDKIAAGEMDEATIKKAAKQFNMPATKENLIKKIDESYGFDMANIGDRIQKELIDPHMLMTKSGEIAPNPTMSKEIAKLQEIANNYRQFGTQKLAAGQKSKQILGKNIKFQSDTVPEGFKKEVYGILADELEQNINKTSAIRDLLENKLQTNATDKSKELADYIAAKRGYQVASIAEKAALGGSGREAAKLPFGLLDYIAGAATGSPAGAVALGTASKGYRKYQASTSSAAAKKLAEILKKTTTKVKEASETTYKALQSGAPVYGTSAAIRGEND